MNAQKLEQIQKVFANDRFATENGVVIDEVDDGYAKCSLEIQPHHLNAGGTVMGGAIFTLADFALAIACNVGEAPTVSVDHTVSFLRATKGSKLTATATCDKPGSHLAFYTVVVTDDLDKQIARMTATCYR